MVFGWYIVTVAMLAAGYVAYSISDAVLAAYCIIVILGIFQFAIAAAQVPMLPMVDTATSQVYGKRWSRFGIRCFWHRMGCWNHNRTNGNRSCFRLYWVLGNYAWNTCNTDVLWLANHSHE